MKPEDATREEKVRQKRRSRSGFLALLGMAIVGALFWFGLWYAAKFR